MTDVAAPTNLSPADDAATAEATQQTAAHETKGERTRRRLLEIAVERFGSRGFRATSVSEIARGAGLTQAAAYAYFEGKEALFVAAVDADAEALIGEASLEVAGTPARQLVPAFIVAAMAALDHHPLAHRVLAGKEPDVVARLVDLPAVRAVSAEFAVEIRHGQDLGEVRTDIDPDLVATGIESIVLALLMSLVMTGGAAIPRHQLGVVEAFDALLRPPA